MHFVDKDENGDAAITCKPMDVKNTRSVPSAPVPAVDAQQAAEETAHKVPVKPKPFYRCR